MKPVTKASSYLWTHTYINKEIILSFQDNGRLNIWNKLEIKTVLDIDTDGRMHFRSDRGMKVVRSNGSSYVY